MLSYEEMEVSEDFFSKTKKEDSPGKKTHIVTLCRNSKSLEGTFKQAVLQ